MSERRRETITALLFASPWAVGFCVFLLYPLVASIYFSFCDYSVLRPPVYIGADNYRDLYHDGVFWQALGNTAIYSIWALPVGTLVALSLAMLLNTKVKGMTVYRTLFFIPSLVPVVAMAVLWQWIFNGDHGILNAVIEGVSRGHIKGPNWLGDPAYPDWVLAIMKFLPTYFSKVLSIFPTYPKLVLVMMSAWGAGNAMVIYLAGLQDVPQALYEAADLDGAGWWAKTRHVTLPMLSPVILFNVIMGIIGTLQQFTAPYVLSPSGSPARSIYLYTMYLYDNAFIFHKMGYACAMGWIMFVIILLLTMLAIKMSERHVHYGGN